ncbi:hypothetical protein EK21DRAFT_94607 [Setomelanomma holmii]|uniref:Uncharacterized protein n=1 Tax=Setomelanomma holmii TaxID=210430 RepID=A0A9P4LG05_9PLEO|nr:hypothetical protein EK21DRAFT_94607 [Setomelanomma holmii]
MPYGWDISRIVHLCIGVGLYRGLNIDTPRTLEAIRWIALPLIKSLRTFRFFFASTFDDNSYFTSGAPPAYIEYIDGNGKLPQGTIWYRQMMRNLIVLVGKDVEISVGLLDMSERLKYYKQEGLGNQNDWSSGPWPPDFTAGAFLKKTFEEYEGLMGFDVGCNKEIPRGLI